MQRLFSGQSNSMTILFFIAIVAFVLSSYYKVSSANRLLDSRLENRQFIIDLSKEFKAKAGVLISKNNFDPVMPNTLLRILLRTNDNYIKDYMYDGKNLIISTTSHSNIIDIRDIVKYLAINKNNNKHIVYLR